MPNRSLIGKGGLRLQGSELRSGHRSVFPEQAAVLKSFPEVSRHGHSEWGKGVLRLSRGPRSHYDRRDSWVG